MSVGQHYYPLRASSNPDLIQRLAVVRCSSQNGNLFSRYCCECGKFSLVAFVWYTMCIFQVVWAGTGLYWLVREVFYIDEDNKPLLSHPPYVTFLEVTLASIVLDIFLAGSELVHKFRNQFRDRPDRVQPQSNYEMKPAA